MNDHELERLLSKIARLYFLEDMSQESIAERLNLNRVRVSRYLKKARERGLVEIRVKSPPEDFQDLEREIERSYGVPECVVVPAHDDPEDTLKEMAGAVSALLERVLEDGDTIGVNFGETLRGISAYLARSRRRGLHVVPITGGVGWIEKGIHTNSIARSFADALGGTSYVINAPAIFDTREAREIMSRDSTVRSILELQSRSACVVLSFSDLGPESSWAQYKILTPKERAYLTGLGAVGDINLDFLDAQGRPVANSISDRTMTFRAAQIREVPVSIGIARGRRKCAAARAVLAGRILKILVVDRILAECLLEQA